MKEFCALIDEFNEPPLRQTLGRLLASARTADLAIAHLRLGGLDLSPSEAGGLQRCRVMLGHLDAATLLGAPDDSSGRAYLQILAAFVASGRLELRTAPHHTWNPDFSIFRGLPADRSVCLVGAHYFGRPYPRFGIGFTGIMTHPGAVQLCARRFEELWEAGYDILPVVADTIHRLTG